MQRTEILDRTRQEVKRRLAHRGAGHGWDHVERVVASAGAIAAETGGDRFVIELAALLHDVGDAKFHGGVERSGEFARQILGALSVEEEVIRHIVQIVENLSFRKRETAEPLSLEGRVVQDADRLDALGAVGIVRTIEYGASVGQPFYASGDPESKTGVGHFYEKLFRLQDQMNTEPGKRLAQQREAFMKTFLSQFFAELSGGDGGS
jgi:uncharacterized protein